jgi:hypothetical protein
LAQALFAALNIAYEEPERRSHFRFYLSAFTFTLLGILREKRPSAEAHQCLELG